MTTEQKFDCVFCQETFEDKETLQIHFRKHGDPKFDKSTKSVKSRTQNEAASAPAEKNAEEVEMVGCDVCEEVFPTISKAITHKHKAHPDHDAKYFCPFCGKLFTMKHLQNKHIQSNHSSDELTASKDFHCDMCDVTFNAPSAMMYHNKFFHRQDTEIPAIGTSKKVKLFNQEMLQIYYCSFCGEEFNNKVNLHKHTGDDHCDENQSPNEVLRCPLCEAIFYHLDAYEIHLTFHSSEDLYSEKNDLFDQITEFSLETVAPIIENVIEEDAATQPEEDNTNTDGVNDFLQLVMGDQGDNISGERIKHKKHKKHKKSKKASITLDEFLNMNKDVFGDGLGDVQGIEEVPTQVVLKKVKKPLNKMVNADLAKLKKQGIVVKANPKNASIRNLNIQKAKQMISASVHNKPNTSQKSPNDILSKLMNQGNSQIKIVKKSAPQSTLKEDDGTNSQSPDSVSPSEQNVLTPEKNDLKSDIPEPLQDHTINSELCDTKNENHKLSLITDIGGKEVTTDTQLSPKCNEVLNYEEAMTSKIPKQSNISYDRGVSSSPIPLRAPNETKNNVLDNHLTEITNEKNINAENQDIDSKEDIEPNSSTKTINALKHLSHLITVKPANQNKIAIPVNINEAVISKEDDSESRGEDTLSKDVNSEMKEPLSKLLKSCGQITIKKQTKSLPSPSVGYDPDSDKEDLENNDNLKLHVDNEKKLIEMKEAKLELEPLSASTCQKYLERKEVARESNDSDSEAQKAEEHEEETNGSPMKACNLDILKRLSNVTAKPVNINKVINQQAAIVKHHQNISPQIKGLQPTKLSKGINEAIEVFNIDDSDDETEENALNNDSIAKPMSNVAADILKNVSRNITIKTSETKTIPNTAYKNTKLQTSSIRSDSYRESYTKIKQSKEIQKSINLQNKLKTLGNITVKSNNSSPNLYNKDFEDYEDELENYESGSDGENVGKVKITEVNEDHMSDTDLNDVHSNAVVQSPNASNSEPDDNHDDFDDELPDFESQIKMNTLKKTEPAIKTKQVPNLDSFKNLNKSLTIKPVNTKNSEQADNSTPDKEESEEPNNSAPEMALKPYVPTVSQNEQPLSKNTTPVHQASGSSNRVALNQKVNVASNQVNTVKSVNTVKRFQSQTVIEEITTTVTKTIRTVNSSTNEVIQSTNQNRPKPINRPLKVINKQAGRELQGTAVRHATPTIGTKIRNAVPIARAPNATIIRPSNQIVPVRPVFNRPRFPTGVGTPSTSAVRKVVPPKCSPQRPTMGKLKISPQALSQASKRPTDEAFGNSSPFKKPKDSLISAQDLPDFGDDADDSPMQYSSTSQTRSDFSSVSKQAKGMVTATQMRSQVSTSSQQQISRGMGTATQMRSEVRTSAQEQLSRLNSVSGLKVVKTSTKQAMQVEERCEITPANRNTLDAIEKLQRQGLLVKKPRIEEEQANPFSESDDEFGE